MPRGRPLHFKPDLGTLFSLGGLWRQHPRYQGCRGHWLMVEGGGLTTYDLSGYGNHGTLTGMDPSSDRVMGPYGPALWFDNVNNLVTCGMPPRVTGNGPRTILCRLAASSFSTAVEDIFCTYSASGGVQGGAMWLAAEDNAIAIDFNGHRIISPKSALVTNRWYLVAVRVPLGATSTSHLQVLIDGMDQVMLTEAGSAKTLNTNGLDNLVIGAQSNGANFFHGQIDEVRIYDYALSDATIKSFGSDPFLEFSWAMQQRRRVWAVEPVLGLTQSAYRFRHDDGLLVAPL